jgi:predicted HicB family RNase H-like nuclease
MRTRSLNQAAEHCRRQSEEFQGKPEGAFLLRLARSFDELASKPALRSRAPNTP